MFCTLIGIMFVLPNCVKFQMDSRKSSVLLLGLSQQYYLSNVNELFWEPMASVPHPSKVKWINWIYPDLVGLNGPYGSLPTWDILCFYDLSLQLTCCCSPGRLWVCTCSADSVLVHCGMCWHFNYFFLELQMNDISTHIPGCQCDILICWPLFCSSSPMSAVFTSSSHGHM